MVVFVTKSVPRSSGFRDFPLVFRLSTSSVVTTNIPGGYRPNVLVTPVLFSGDTHLGSRLRPDPWGPDLEVD